VHTGTGNHRTHDPSFRTHYSPRTEEPCGGLRLRPASAPPFRLRGSGFSRTSPGSEAEADPAAASLGSLRRNTRAAAGGPSSDSSIIRPLLLRRSCQRRRQPDPLPLPNPTFEENPEPGAEGGAEAGRNVSPARRKSPFVLGYIVRAKGGSSRAVITGNRYARAPKIVDNNDPSPEVMTPPTSSWIDIRVRTEISIERRFVAQRAIDGRASYIAACPPSRQAMRPRAAGSRHRLTLILATMTPDCVLRAPGPLPRSASSLPPHPLPRHPSARAPAFLYGLQLGRRAIRSVSIGACCWWAPEVHRPAFSALGRAQTEGRGDEGSTPRVRSRAHGESSGPVDPCSGTAP